MRPSNGNIVPRFTAPERASSVGSAVSFNPAASTSTNALSSATWNFGDGSQTKFLFGTTTLSRVKHPYKKPGQYNVTLTLVDNTGNLKTTTKHVTIRHP
jgi:PKD repeat protein